MPAVSAASPVSSAAAADGIVRVKVCLFGTNPMVWWRVMVAANRCSEPISKSPEQYAEGRKLHEAGEIVWVILTANQEASLALNPCEEELDDPVAFVAAQPVPVGGELPIKRRRRFRIFFDNAVSTCRRLMVNTPATTFFPP